MLVNALDVARITGSAHVNVGNMSAQNLVFNATDIANHTLQDGGDPDYTQSLVTSLVGNLNLNVTMLRHPDLLGLVTTSQGAGPHAAAARDAGARHDRLYGADHPWHPAGRGRCHRAWRALQQRGRGSVRNETHFFHISAGGGGQVFAEGLELGGGRQAMVGIAGHARDNGHGGADLLVPVDDRGCDPT